VSTQFWPENLKVRDYLKDLAEDVRPTVKWILNEIGCENVDWIQLVEDRAYKVSECINQLNDYWLFKNFPSWS
jgi:hypothetical protein